MKKREAKKIFDHYLKAKKEYESMLKQIPEILKNEGVLQKTIAEELNFHRVHIYRKMNDPSLFTEEEVEKIFEILQKKRRL